MLTNVTGAYLGCGFIFLALFVSISIAAKFKKRHAGDINENNFVKVRCRSGQYSFDFCCRTFWRKAIIVRKHADQKYDVRFVHHRRSKLVAGYHALNDQSIQGGIGVISFSTTCD
jgi:hypothetical protein